jgi:hypothetical protein
MQWRSPGAEAILRRVDCATSCQSSIPKLFQRPGLALTTASKREPPLASAIRKLNARQCDSRSSE